MNEPGTIAVVSGELLRYTSAIQAIMALQAPVGTKTYWTQGINVADNLNKAIRAMEGEWIFFMGDDHAFKPDLLMRLLAHNVDMVAPRVQMRHHPFHTVAYRKESARLPGFWIPTGFDTLPPTGLMEVAAGTNAGLLVRRHVLEALRDPWFEVGKGGDPAQLAEDVQFWKKVRSAGFKGYIDVDAKLGHTTAMTVWPADGTERGVDLEVSPGILFPLRYEREEVRYPDGTLIGPEDR